MESRAPKSPDKERRKRVARQGPWDPADPTFSLDGVLSQPMPVIITDPKEFKPFFHHLAVNGNYIIEQKATVTSHHGIDLSAEISAQPGNGMEASYNVELLEFPRGVLYADRRMDLCKQALGPPSLPLLLDALKTNTFVRHFLFGNNIIGPNATKRIADWISQYPERIETWYLAGNCIDAGAFSALTDSLVKSAILTNVWLKRNPLSLSSVLDIVRLLTQAPNLRTLDLDQTSLGDWGVAMLFSHLAHFTAEKPISLRHIYLNAVGASISAAKQTSRFLASKHCQLESIYLSNNPLGSAGVVALSDGVAVNETLKRLALQSVGMTDEGANAVLGAAAKHEKIMFLDIGYSFATEDLGSRYNWYTDEIVLSAQAVIRQCTSLRSLDLGYTQLSRPGMNQVTNTFVQDPNHRILHFFGQPAVNPDPRSYDAVKAGQTGVQLRKLLRQRLHDNVKAIHGPDMDYDRWAANEKRWLQSPQDVRFIDSVYRNRDAAEARRGVKWLKKWWDEGDTTLEDVLGSE